MDDTLRMPVKSKRMTFDEAGYPGFWAEVRTNPPMRTMEEDWRSGDVARFKAAVRLLLVDWNFVDLQGEPIPLPEGVYFGAVPPDLFGALVDAEKAAYDEAQSLPLASKSKSEST
jgi:hypothetical protein